MSVFTAVQHVRFDDKFTRIFTNQQLTIYEFSKAYAGKTTN